MKQLLMNWNQLLRALEYLYEILNILLPIILKNQRNNDKRNTTGHREPDSEPAGDATRTAQQ